MKNVRKSLKYLKILKTFVENILQLSFYLKNLTNLTFSRGN